MKKNSMTKMNSIAKFECSLQYVSVETIEFINNFFDLLTKLIIIELQDIIIQRKYK